ncbi:MAG: YgiT-type zinc finger protein [Candidatus Thorarchaeota archaeon]
MKCALCKGNIVESVTNLSYEIGSDRLIVVSKVPALVCKQCGDYFVEIVHLRKAEEIIDKPRMTALHWGL